MSFLSALFNKPSKEDITRFNYYSCFTSIPTLVERYNNHEIPFDEVVKVKNYHDGSEMSEKLSSKVEIVESGIKSRPEITLTLIVPPSTGLMAEVECAMIAHNSKLHHAVMFTMEYSLGEFMLCAPTPNQHGNLGEVKDRQHFCYEVFQRSKAYWDKLESANHPIAIF